MRYARAVVVAAVVVVLAGCWAVPGAGPQRSGHNPIDGGLTTANVASLAADWTWTADWTTAHSVLEPVTSPGGVHVSVGHELVTVDPVTGHERWRRQLYDPTTTVPTNAGKAAFGDGRVLVPVFVYRNFAPGAGTHSYDPVTGADLGIVAHNAGDASIPRDGRIVGTWGEIIGTGIGAQGMFVLDRNDPSASWSSWLSVFGTSGTPALTSPAVGPHRFFIAFDGAVRAYPLTKPADCPEPEPGYPFCNPDWSDQFGTGLTRPTLTSDDKLVVVGNAGHVWALDPDSGSTMWSGPLPTSNAPTAPLSADDHHVFAVVDGKLVAYDRSGCGAATCNPVWTAETGGTVASQPAVAGGVVYTATTSGVIRAFPAAGCGAATCASLWSHDVGTGITGGPSVSLGRLFVGTDDGRLIAFHPTAHT